VKTRRNEFVLLLLFIVLGAALRLHRLGAESLWYDETVSVLLATKPVGAMLAHTARDIHPPLYYMLLNLWVRFAGTSEFAVAWLSWAVGVLLLPTTYMLGRDMPILAVALLSIAPYHVWYSQEVRMYALGALWAVLAGYAAWGMLLRQQAGEDVARGRQWRFFVLFSALGLYTLYYFAFWLAAIGVALLIIIWKNRLTLRPWLEAAIATFVLWLPWFPIAVRQAIEPPVPPWRGAVPFSTMFLETLTGCGSALSCRMRCYCASFLGACAFSGGLDLGPLCHYCANFADIAPLVPCTLPVHLLAFLLPGTCGWNGDACLGDCTSLEPPPRCGARCGSRLPGGSICHLGGACCAFAQGLLVSSRLCSG